MRSTRPKIKRVVDDEDEEYRVSYRITTPAALVDSLWAWWRRTREQVSGPKTGAASETLTVSGGEDNGATTLYSTIPGGKSAKTYMYGQLAYASGRLTGVGSAQMSYVVARLQNTSTGAVQIKKLYLDGIGELLVVENNTAWFIDWSVIHHWLNGATIEINTWAGQGAILRGSTALSTTLLGDTTAWVAGNGTAPGAPYLAADTTNGALSLNVVTFGVLGRVQSWVAKVALTEISY